MKFCPFCGAQLKEGHVFCGECGKRLNGPVSSKPAPPHEARTKSFGALSVLSIALSTVGVVISLGPYLEVPSLTIAAVGTYKGERGGRVAVAFALLCIVVSLFFGSLLMRFFGNPFRLQIFNM